MTRSQMDAAFSVLPKGEYEPTLKEIIEARVLVANVVDGPGTMVAIGLFAMPTVPAANRMLDLEVMVLAAKREQLQGGGITFKSHQLNALSKEQTAWFQGFHFESVLDINGTEIVTAGILGARGDVVIELNYIGVPMDLDAAIAMSEGLLGKPSQEVPKEEPDEEPEAQEQ
jgi:hypothetical protein